MISDDKPFSESASPPERSDRAGAVSSTFDLVTVPENPEDRPASADVLERAFSAMVEPSSWTQDDARAWWRDHRDDLVRVRAARTTSGRDLIKPRIQRSATLVA